MDVELMTYRPLKKPYDCAAASAGVVVDRKTCRKLYVPGFAVQRVFDAVRTALKYDGNPYEAAAVALDQAWMDWYEATQRSAVRPGRTSGWRDTSNFIVPTPFEGSEMIRIEYAGDVGYMSWYPEPPNGPILVHIGERGGNWITLPFDSIDAKYNTELAVRLAAESLWGRLYETKKEALDNCEDPLFCTVTVWEHIKYEVV